MVIPNNWRSRLTPYYPAYEDLRPVHAVCSIPTHARPLGTRSWRLEADRRSPSTDVNPTARQAHHSVENASAAKARRADWREHTKSNIRSIVSGSNPELRTSKNPVEPKAIRMVSAWTAGESFVKSTMGSVNILMRFIGSVKEERKDHAEIGRQSCGLISGR